MILKTSKKWKINFNGNAYQKKQQQTDLNKKLKEQSFFSSILYELLTRFI